MDKPVGTWQAQGLVNLAQTTLSLCAHLISQTGSLLCTLLRHAFYGPLLPSWSLTHTLLVFALRFFITLPVPNIAWIRMLDLLPWGEPQNGVYAPFEVVVEGPDESEQRTLSGEIVTYDEVDQGQGIFFSSVWFATVCNILDNLWRLSKSCISPKSLTSLKQVCDELKLRQQRLILYFHGGAYYTLSSASHRPITREAAKVIRGLRITLDITFEPSLGLAQCRLL
jgi:hypothetical protein